MSAVGIIRSLDVRVATMMVDDDGYVVNSLET